jgi:hypothetical protein
MESRSQMADNERYPGGFPSSTRIAISTGSHRIQADRCDPDLIVAVAAAKRMKQRARLQGGRRPGRGTHLFDLPANHIDSARV